jgi:hypothetical protein
MAENWKHLYEQMKKMVAMYQDEIVPGLRQQVEELEAKIATGNNVGSKWISVNDRLPKKGEIVLACGKRHATSGMFQGASRNNPKWWHWKGNTLKEVTHWMPLPEPPKGE